MASNPLFDLAKNFIVEGLSAKLETYENLKKKSLQINIEPRVYYEVEGLQKKPLDYGAGDVKESKGLGGLLNMFDQAAAQKAQQPLKQRAQG